MKSKRLIISIFLIIISLLSINLFKNNNIIIINTSRKQIDEKYNYKETDQINGTEIDNDDSNTVSDVIGKIIIKGTAIDEEIVQGTDNEFYLNHSISKKKNIQGSIFMDYRNNLDDRKLLIYGHNSKTLKKALFHDLEKYLNSSFYNKNKYIELTLNNEKVTYEIFSVMIIEEGNNHHMKITFNDKEFMEYINWMENKSLYQTGVEVSTNDKIITLQTCYYNPNNSYLIINAKKIK